MIYIILIAATVYSIKKLRNRPRKHRLEYRPEWYEPETVELEPFEEDQDDTEPVAEDDIAALQAQIDLDHWTAQLGQFEALQATHKAELAAIRETREKQRRLSEYRKIHGANAANAFLDCGPEYIDLYFSTDIGRDYSEKREAIVQRALITDANNIYACQKRIAKAKMVLKGE